jgi:hypothetical protein
MSTTTYTIGQVLDQARQMGAYDGTARVITDWMNARRDDLPYDTMRWSEIWRELTDTQREAVNKAHKDALTAAERVTRELLDVISRMRDWKLQGAEDRRFIAEVRCMIDDGDHELRHGNLREAHRRLLDASRRLTWVVDTRGRNSRRSDRHPHVEMAREMHETVAQLNVLADTLGGAA